MWRVRAEVANHIAIERQPLRIEHGASGLLGKFGNTQPIRKRHRQGSRAPDWPLLIQASETQAMALVDRPEGRPAT